MLKLINEQCNNTGLNMYAQYNLNGMNKLDMKRRLQRTFYKLMGE